MQGSGNLYTALEKRFFVPDPDLQWRISDRHPIWLGLEVCAVLAGWLVATLVACWFISRRERAGRGSSILRGALWVVAALSLAIPAAAFLSGSRPAGAVDLRPVTAAKVVDSGFDGKLALPAGRYEVVAHEATAVVARVSAGGEAFDARFAKDIVGGWQGDPSDLAKPMTGEVSVATAAVDTGIDKRSAHARDGYLLASKHPRITFALGKILAAKQESPNSLAFKAEGTVGLAGKTHAVTITGTLSKPDEAAQARLKLTGSILRVESDLSIAIAETAFAADKKDFDGDHIPIHVSLVLRHTGA